MPVISGKHAFLEILKQEGVEVMFGNPGTTELPLMDALAGENEHPLRAGLQEAAVMAMADGYAQASGKLAVVNVHVSPGLGNAMGMLYDAQKAGSPMLVTAGQHDQGFNRHRADPLGGSAADGAALREMVDGGHRARRTCRGWCTAPPRPRSRRRPGRCSSRCRSTC